MSALVNAHNAQINGGTPSAKSGCSAIDYATRLAVSLWEKHYKDDAPDWKPLDDLIGVLTQIDNMICGLQKPDAPDEARCKASLPARCSDGGSNG